MIHVVLRNLHGCFSVSITADLRSEVYILDGSGFIKTMPNACCQLGAYREFIHFRHLLANMKDPLTMQNTERIPLEIKLTI